MGPAGAVARNPAPAPAPLFPPFLLAFSPLSVSRFLLPALLLPVFVQARITAPDTTATRAAAPAPATPAASPLTFYGFVDGYFGYDFHDPASHARPGFLYSHNRTVVNQLCRGLCF